MIKDTAGILAGVQSPMPQPHRREVYGKKKKRKRDGTQDGSERSSDPRFHGK
jgi:hypothetical protein